MHISKIKNRVVATAVATTVACSNVGVLVYADDVKLDKGNVVKASEVKSRPVIHAEDVYVEVGAIYDVKEGVEATDTDGSIITKLIEVEGMADTTLDTSRERRQTVLYKLTNTDGKTVYKSRDIYVVSKAVVNIPDLVVDDYGVLSIKDSGVESNFSTDNFTNKEWSEGYFDVVGEDSASVVKRGDKVITSDGIDGTNTSTANEFVFSVKKDGVLKIGVSADGAGDDKIARVTVDGDLVYDSSTIANGTPKNAMEVYENVPVPVKEGSHTVVFEYSFDAPAGTEVASSDRMYIHSMSLDTATESENLLKGIKASDRLEYRINNKEWVEYKDSVDLKDLDKTEENKKVDVDARAISITNLGDVSSSIASDSLHLFSEPTIEVADKEIVVGDSLDIKGIVSAIDADGTDISKDVEVVTSNLDTKKPGIYNITYRVTNKKGVTVVKTITVTVKGTTNNGEVPTITLASDKIELLQGSVFNALNGVVANDKEDGSLTHKIVVPVNTVNTNIPGIYTVVYEVTDNDGNKATKTLRVVVKENKGNAPVINAIDLEIEKGSVFDPMYGVTAKDKEGVDITTSVKIVSNNVDTSKVGEYSVVYEATDSSNNKVTKTVKITVKDTNKVQGEVPVIHASDRTVSVGTVVNVLEGVTATDKEDGDITEKMEVISNPLNTSVEGKYTVQLGVKDKDGNVTVKNVIYTVVANNSVEVGTNNGTNNGVIYGDINNGTVIEAQKPVINATDIIIPLGMNMAYILEGVTATDNVDGNISNKVQVKSTNIDFNKEGNYKATFIVTNSKGVSAEKEINVQVSANAAVNTNGNESANNTNGGSTVSSQENVKTFDNVTMYLGTFVTSLLGSAGLLLKLRRRE